MLALTDSFRIQAPMTLPTWSTRFEHDAWANRLILDALIENDWITGEHGATLTHLLGWQRVWYARLTGMDTTGMHNFPDPTRAQLEHDIEESAQRWGAYTCSLSDGDLAAEFTHTATEGGEYTNALGVILHQLVTHGVHHRSQISTAIRQAGIAPPALDFIYFMHR
jgi:uncharacterized damage-inducible protein DinB